MPIVNAFDAINDLDNYQRSVCFGRYIIGNNWNDIASQLGYEVRQCQRFELEAINSIIKKRSKNNEVS